MSAPEQPIRDLAEIDPAEDRDEFERRLNKLFLRKDHTKDFVEALMMNDVATQEACKEEVLKQRARKEKYLKAWDNASGKEAKQSVVGQVKGDYEPSAEEIDALRPKA